MFAGNKSSLLRWMRYHQCKSHRDGFGNVVAKFSQYWLFRRHVKAGVDVQEEALISASLDVIARAINHVGAENAAGSGYQ